MGTGTCNAVSMEFYVCGRHESLRFCRVRRLEECWAEDRNLFGSCRLSLLANPESPVKIKSIDFRDAFIPEAKTSKEST